NADEALLLNTDGYVVEASSGNLFYLLARDVLTPPLATGILPGVTRSVVFELCQHRSIAIREQSVRPEELKHCGGVFLSLSSQGILQVDSLDSVPLKRSPLIADLRSAYWDLVRSECE